MRWSEYLEKSAETAIYKNRFYPYLGLAGEAGEVLSELYRASGPQDAILKELGDVCWYVAAITRDERLSVVPSPTYIMVEPGPGIVIEAGKVMELVKKANRDGEDVFTVEQVAALTDALGRILGYIFGLAHMYGSSLEDVLQTNYEKLKSRKARGVLGGSGSER